MRHLLKLWLLCLLSLALPIQGSAAVFMLSCGQGHQGMGHAAAAHQNHAAHAHGSMHHATDHEAVLDGGAPANHEPEAEGDRASKTKCSACASCCIAAALPSPALSLEDTREPSHFMVASGSSSPSFVTSGPERPPRSFLA